jgi:hypothetical protein
MNHRCVGKKRHGSRVSAAEPIPHPHRFADEVATASRRKLSWVSNGRAGFGMACREGERLGWSNAFSEGR